MGGDEWQSIFVKKLLFSFQDFGKDFIKSCRCSPDSWIQVKFNLVLSYEKRKRAWRTLQRFWEMHTLDVLHLSSSDVDCWMLHLQSINNRWHQMALQLTMHRLTGGIVPTYESASTRRWENSWNRKHLSFVSWNFWIFVIFSILYVIFNLHVSGKTLQKRQAGRI